MYLKELSESVLKMVQYKCNKVIQNSQLLEPEATDPEEWPQDQSKTGGNMTDVTPVPYSQADPVSHDS